MADPSVVILGAGPAGLAAALELGRRGVRPVVLEKSGEVGGIARTVDYKGYAFDVGGHRFFTRIERVDRLWREMLGEALVEVRRLSRIFYRGRFFDYPLRFTNALLNLGVVESGLIVSSYLAARLRSRRQETTFEQWVSNRFGPRLYRAFFKTYTEKVWGVPGAAIQADWAAQRIRGLSLAAAVAHALFGRRTARSLIEVFHYPTRGPGMMWRRCREAIEAGGGEIRLQAEAVRIAHARGRVTGLTFTDAGGTAQEAAPDHVISSIPLAGLVARLEPPPPAAVREAAAGLAHRAFIMVGLIVDATDLFRDQWIYVHSPGVQVGRIQNFRNWSAAMVPDPDRTGIGMEYFCWAGDAQWHRTDREMIELAARELAALGLADRDQIVDGFVVRQPHAYPVYDRGYRERLGILRGYLGTFENLQTIGRSGLHRYNNMDHAMATGLLAAENVLGARHDVWRVNEEEAYLEEGGPPARGPASLEPALVRAFARMDKLAFATAVGAVAGLAALAATLWPLIRGGSVLPLLELLGNYFPGYTVSVRGAVLAFACSFGWGFLFGWLFAYLRNLLFAAYANRARRREEMLTIWDFFDQI